MLSSPGPCASVYLTLPSTAPNQSAKTNAVAWKDTVRTIEEKLRQQGEEGRQIFESISRWEDVSQGLQPGAKSIAVFRSPQVFCVSWSQTPFKNRAFAGSRFYIRPLLMELTGARTFYLLALSQKNVRLLRCTNRSCEEVPLAAETATSFDAYMNAAKPDHVSTDSSSAGPSGGHTKGIVASTSTTREDKSEYLAHFFRQIDRGVNELLRGSSEPLVLAAVDYELAQYRSLNTYPHLAKEDVQGAPNSLKSGEMHARALDALGRCYAQKVDGVLAEYDHKVGGGASNRLKDVVTAAHDGRVLTLLVSDSLESAGEFDKATHSAKGHRNGTADDEDLINDTVIETVLHGGQVFATPNGKLPNGAPLAAVFRY